MNTTPTTAKKLIEAIIKEHDRGNYHDILICPPFTSLDVVSKNIQNKDIALGAQNHSQYDNGAYTGEVSASMLKDIGCEYVILGHSERRKFFGESDKIITKKSVDADETNRVKMSAKTNSEETSGTLCSFSFGCSFTQKRRRMYRRANEILVGYSMEAML